VAETAPETIGKYQVTDLLGKGAMGVVYRALDPLLGRHVAIKVMSQGIASDQELRDRFLREARAAGSLQHPNIITIYDFGEAAGSLYIAMEYIEGSDLSEIMDRRDPLPLPAKLDIIIDTLNGLDYAHSRGVVHRDVKPANIRVSVDGRAKLMDFGIARLEKSDLTRSGMMIGTPDYMAPEQVSGGLISAATDVFAMGVVLYEFLTNRRTFDGETLHAVLYKVVSEQPPPLQVAAPNVPSSLQPILDRALAKDPAQRYPTAGLMARDLSAVRTALSGGATVVVAARATPLHTGRLARPPRRGRRRLRPAWIAAAAAALALGAGVMFLPDVLQRRSAVGEAAPAVGGGPERPESLASTPATGPGPEVVRPASASVSESAPPPPRTAARRQEAAPPLVEGAGRRSARLPPEGIPAGTPPVTALPAAPPVSVAAVRADTAVLPVTTPVAPAPAPQPAAAAPQPVAPAPDPRPQIEQLITAYAEAIESQSVAEMRRLYPGMTPDQQRSWERFFASGVQSVRVRLAVDSLEIAGPSATFAAVGRWEYDAAGRTQRQPMSFRAIAAQTAAGWRLRTIH
jgi:predicted Ser/Thr protein kinase